MGTFIGHLLPGVAYLLIGLWHLYNHIKLHCQHPKSYSLPAWFPAPMVRHLELYFIMLGSFIYMGTELFLGPSRHHPLDPIDWTIPTQHLHNFEHATIALSIFTYAAFALHLDRARLRASRTVALLIGAATFTTEFLLFYLHSTDHVGLEWQCHWLLQTTIAVSVGTTLLGIGRPSSFAVGFTRSVSVLFRGVWYIVLSAMVYRPRFNPKGCHLQEDDGFFTIPCDGPASLHRAKSLANLEFAWSLAAVVIFSGWLYLHLSSKYPEAAEYECLGNKEEGSGQDGFPESPKKQQQEEEKAGCYLQMGKLFGAMDLER